MDHSGQPTNTGQAFGSVDVDYQQTQDVEAELQYEPDGSLTLLESVWGELK